MLIFAVQQVTRLYIHTHIYRHSFIFFSIMVYHRRLSIVPRPYSRALFLRSPNILYTRLHLLIPNTHCVPPLPSILLGNPGSLVCEPVSDSEVGSTWKRGHASVGLSLSGVLGCGVMPLGPSCSPPRSAALVAVPPPPTAAGRRTTSLPP